MKNLLDISGLDLKDECFETLIKSEAIQIERIVSNGHASPDDFEYDQERNEWIFLLEGQAHLTIDDRSVILSKGDCLNIPSHQKHRVEWTDKQTIWLAVYY